MVKCVEITDCRSLLAKYVCLVFTFASVYVVGILVHKDNSTAVKHGASLLMLLLFDETAPATM